MGANFECCELRWRDADEWLSLASTQEKVPICCAVDKEKYAFMGWEARVDWGLLA
jgi:hypothetical protein